MQSIKCAIELCLKKQSTYPNQKYFIAQGCIVLCREYSQCFITTITFKNCTFKYCSPVTYIIVGDVQLLSRVQLFCDLMDYSPPGFSVHGISQARMLEWVAISFSRASSCPEIKLNISCIAGRFLTVSHQENPNLYNIVHQLHFNIYTLLLKNKNTSINISMDLI